MYQYDWRLVESGKDNLERPLASSSFRYLEADALDISADGRVDVGRIHGARPGRVHVAVTPDDPVVARHVLEPPLDGKGELFAVRHENLLGRILRVGVQAEMKRTVALVVIAAHNRAVRVGGRQRGRWPVGEEGVNRAIDCFLARGERLLPAVRMESN